MDETETEPRCLLCYCNIFEKRKDYIICLGCGVRVQEPWITLKPELRRIVMKDLHKSFEFDLPDDSTSYKTLKDYLLSLRDDGVDEANENLQIKIKICKKCASIRLKMYKDKVFCLACANLSSNDLNENDNVGEEDSICGFTINDLKLIPNYYGKRVMLSFGHT